MHQKGLFIIGVWSLLTLFIPYEKKNYIILFNWFLVGIFKIYVFVFTSSVIFTNTLALQLNIVKGTFSFLNLTVALNL